MILHGRLQALTGRDLVAHLADALLVDDVARGAGDRLQRLDERHAGANIVDSVRA